MGAVMTGHDRLRIDCRGMGGVDVMDAVDKMDAQGQEGLE